MATFVINGDFDSKAEIAAHTFTIGEAYTVFFEESGMAVYAINNSRLETIERKPDAK